MSSSGASNSGCMIMCVACLLYTNVNYYAPPTYTGNLQVYQTMYASWKFSPSMKFIVRVMYYISWLHALVVMIAAKLC